MRLLLQLSRVAKKLKRFQKIMSDILFARHILNAVIGVMEQKLNDNSDSHFSTKFVPSSRICRLLLSNGPKVELKMNTNWGLERFSLIL